MLSLPPFCSSCKCWLLLHFDIFHTGGEIYPSTRSKASPVEYLVGNGSQEADDA